ncbi:MAG TPA: amidohydrolase family protein, partial [Candidatus Hydrogenedentes bacterium]|nr:amidohydrolase family protein [Candidatus Hydrogenedentota bacterium]
MGRGKNTSLMLGEESKNAVEEAEVISTGARSKASRRETLANSTFYVVLLVAVSNFVTYTVTKVSSARPAKFTGPGAAALAVVDPGLKEFHVVNAHEHLYKRSHLDKYLKACKATGIERTLFVASSARTLMGSGFGIAEYNEKNSRDILNAAKEMPERIIPFCTLRPGDPGNLEKLKAYVAEGAKGLKLYSGHAQFYEKPLDTEEMLPIYAYCEESGLPICWHVNMRLYGKEFRRVMARFPELTVIIPHFGVTFYNPKGRSFRAFQELLDTYPNLYTDTSFGTRGILVNGLGMVSRHRDVFRAFFEKYSDRVFFGTDMVVTGNSEKTPEWIESVLRACRDVLEKDAYYFWMAATGSKYAVKGGDNPYGALKGLNLDDETLRKIYETNVDRLFPP